MNDNEGGVTMGMAKDGKRLRIECYNGGAVVIATSSGQSQTVADEFDADGIPEVVAKAAALFGVTSPGCGRR